MKNSKFLYLALGGGLLFLVLLLWFLLSGGSNKNAATEQERRKKLSSFDDPTLELAEFARNADVPFAKVLADFREWAQYPPDSRPLTASDTDILRHEKIELPMMPMPIVEDNKLKEAIHACVLQAETHTVYEDQTHETQLRCQNIASGKFVMPDIKAVKLTRSSGIHTFSAPPPDIVKNDAKTPVSVSFFFKPRPSDWGDMELTVDFTLPDEKTSHVHRLKTHFFSSPQAPAKFTGNFRERLERGSLIISAEIQVRLAGSYRIEANLLADNGDPVAHARTDTKLGGGTQWVDLLFFGKIFRDRRIPGPYKLTGLRGQQMNLPINPDDLTLPPEQVEKILQNTQQTEPIKRAIIPWLREYRTEAYKLDQFSDAEYDSEFKRERIRELERLAAAQ
ncbi:MAG: hypothetical protein N2Z22_11770 [Turneriella sp.]|nr:hypothetical protein [Turneriella sp.]